MQSIFVVFMNLEFTNDDNIRNRHSYELWVMGWSVRVGVTTDHLLIACLSSLPYTSIPYTLYTSTLTAT